MSNTHRVTKRAINYSENGMKSSRLPVGHEFSPKADVVDGLESAGLIEKIAKQKAAKKHENKDAGKSVESKATDG